MDRDPATHAVTPEFSAAETRLAAIEEQLNELRRENDTLRRQVAQLSAGVSEPEVLDESDQPPAEAAENLSAPQPPQESGTAWSRRALLLGGVGTAAGALHLAATGSPAAAAAGDALLLGRNNTSGASATYVTSSNAQYTFHADSEGGQASALRGSNNIGNGVLGSSVSGTGVKGNSSSGVGVFGTTAHASGVYGTVSGNGEGVAGHAFAGGTGLEGVSNAGVGAVVVSVSGPALRIATGGIDSLPKARDWIVGDIVATSNAQFWLCVQSGNPGQWRLLGSPNSAGAYIPLTPTRVFDTRTPQPDAGRILIAGTERTFGIGQSRDLVTGAPTGQLLPPGTKAVAVNVTITGTTGSGFLALTPGVAGTFSASTINWSGPNQTIANGLTLTADSLLRLKAWVRGGDTHLTVDVMGYFSQV